MISADAFRGLIALVLVVISAADMPLWAIGLLVFLMGLGDAFGAPAGAAIVPSLLPDHLLPAGNVARGIVAKIGTIVGPGVGGISVAVVGADLTFAVTAVAFLSVLRYCSASLKNRAKLLLRANHLSLQNCVKG